MIAPVLRLGGTNSRAMKTLDTISSNSKMWPNSLTSSLRAARGRAYFYNSQQGHDCPSPCRALSLTKNGYRLQVYCFGALEILFLPGAEHFPSDEAAAKLISLFIWPCETSPNLGKTHR